MNGKSYRFGLFEFNLSTRELRRNGALVRLQPQPAQVLACLIERAGELVSRDELRLAVWGGETFVDFDRGLNFCIAQVRSALGDDPSSPRYIQTIARRGYQFIAPVIPPVGAAIPASPIPPVATPTIKVAAAQNPIRRKFSLSLIALIFAAGLLVALAASAGYGLRAWQVAHAHPIIAVVRFDNETGDSAVTRFSDALTDTLVEQLTTASRGRFEVIGNAQILRLPRDQRDLTAIAASLHAKYVVLGQVQSDGNQTRILAHLIRLPEQTHLWVARMDRSLTDPLATESEAAAKIAAAFAPRVITDSSGTPLPPLPSQIPPAR